MACVEACRRGFFVRATACHLEQDQRDREQQLRAAANCKAAGKIMRRGACDLGHVVYFLLEFTKLFLATKLKPEALERGRARPP